MKTSIVIAIIATVILVGCSQSRKASKQSTGNEQSRDTIGTADNNSIINKYWKLITLEGQKVTMSKNQEREAHFILKQEHNSITGFAGCNAFGGTYTLEPGWRIRFSQMAATLRACPDVDFNEHQFLKVFELADNYTVRGDTLSLNVGRRAPLAVFEAVYFH